MIGFAWLLAQEQRSASLAVAMSEAHKDHFQAGPATPILQSAVFVKGNTLTWVRFSIVCLSLEDLSSTAI